MTHHDADDLITRYIVPDPHLTSEVEARLSGSHIHVWAIVAQLRVNDGDIEQTARDYDIPLHEVEATRAYYQRHRAEFDARLADHVIIPAKALVPAAR